MDTLIIVMSIGLGLILLFGIYKLATSSLHERSVLKPGTDTADRRQTLKAFLAILFSILLFLTLFVTWRIFTSSSAP